MNLYALAMLGATACAVGDALCIAAARGHHPRLALGLAALCFAASAPLWLAMLRLSKGSFAEPAAAWGVVGCVFTVALAMVASGRQTMVQWIGFGLIVLGATVRALGDR